MSTNINGLAIFDLAESFLTDLASEHESIKVFGGGGSKKGTKKKTKKDKNQDCGCVTVINNIFVQAIATSVSY